MKRTVRRRLSKGMADKFFLLTVEIKTGVYSVSLYAPILANRTERVVEVTDFLPEHLRSLCVGGKEFPDEDTAHAWFSSLLLGKDNGFIRVFDCEYHTVVKFDELDDIVRMAYTEWLRDGCCNGSYYGDLSGDELVRAFEWVDNRPDELIEQFKPDWELFTGFKPSKNGFIFYALNQAFLNYCRNSISE